MIPSSFLLLLYSNHPITHIHPSIQITRSYDLPEKIAIAQQYLIPKARAEAGIPVGGEHVPESLTITEGTWLVGWIVNLFLVGGLVPWVGASFLWLRLS